MTPPPRSVIVGTAGHIDHGKTTLVRALTGIDTDRLPEEKRRGITIDLGFASMEMQSPEGIPLRLSFVDVPGHSLFVRNMLAGTGCVPAVMLVIAADEGIKPQTIEHLAICQLLGIGHGIVAVTKADAVSKDHLDGVCHSIHAFLKGTFLENDAPIVPVSARTGDGLALLRTELINLALRVDSCNSDGLVRLPLDRSFVIKGFGTVVTGTLLSGSIHESESLTLEPGSRTVRVRGLQTHGQTVSSAQAGSRVAVNLSGVDASEIQRGLVLVLPQSVSSVDTIDAEITLLPGVPSLKHRASVHFHAFTSEVMASVSLYGYESALPGSRRFARLKFANPVVLVPGDRFVLRQPAPVATIGGGRVLDAYPEPRMRKRATLAWLEQLSASTLPQQLILRISRHNTSGLRIDALARETGLTIDAVRRHLVSALQQSETLLMPGDIFLGRDAYRGVADLIVSRLKNATGRSSPGMKRSELRSQAELDVPVFDFVLSAMEREQKVQIEDEHVLPAGESGRPTAPDDKLLAAISRAYEEAGLASPSVPELTLRLQLGNAEMRRLITLLQRQRTIVRMGSDDLFVHANALRSLSARMTFLRGQTLDVASFKQLTGLSRKYAIPLLEYLDRERITRKQGNERLVL